MANVNVQEFLEREYIRDAIEQGDMDAVYSVADEERCTFSSVLTRYLIDECGCTAEELLDGVTKIYPYMFAKCTSIENLVIPNHIKSIEVSAFARADNLKTVVIPNSVKELSMSAFQSCGLESITIPGSIKKIEDNAFHGCYNLESVILEQGVEEIGCHAFNSCLKLKSISLPEGLKTIRAEAFVDCVDLEQIDLPKSLGRVEISTFMNCTNLKNVTLSCKLKRICSTAFYGACVTDIHFDGTKQQWRNMSRAEDFLMIPYELRVHCSDGLLKAVRK